MIPHKTVQEILETAKVEEVVQDFVTLRRRGVNMIGLCPFHAEKTPSFTVSPTKNIFKCFGCGKAGDAAKFLMEHEHFSYPEALRFLARKYNIEIEEQEVTPEMRAAQQEEDSLFIVNDNAKTWFQQQLFDSDEGKSIGLDYFKERGFREETIRKFGLGYAPNQSGAFTQQAVNAGFKLEYLKKLGLTSQHGRDFFRNRVMFTIHNLSGKPVAFAGRIMQKDAKAPKYINSPETDIYSKSKILYGAYFAKKDIRKLNECILVEGYTDVISLHQAGIENVVASSGTSLTEGQISLIKRFTPNIKILYDGDPAGVKAALRGLDMVLERDMNVKVVLLPEGEDPDSYLQSVGATAFKEYIGGQARDFILFKTDLLLSEVKSDPVKRAGLVRDIVQSIAKVPDPFKRSFYIKECARVMELEEQILVTETNKAVKQFLYKKQKERERNRGTQVHIVDEKDVGKSVPDVEVLPPEANRPESSKLEFQEKDIIRLLLAYGGEIYDKHENITVAEYILSNIEEVLDDFENPLYLRIAKDCLQRLVNEEPLTPQYFIGHTDPAISALAVDLLHTPWEYSPGWEERDLNLTSQKMPEENFTHDSESALLRFKLTKVIRLCEQNQEQLKELETGENPTELMRLLKVQTKLLQMRNELAKQLGTVVIK
ncbi:MAG: DNA primase [Saprospiraceae bacterium]